VSARDHPRQTRRSLIRVVQPLFGESGWEAPRALSCVAVSLLLLFLFLVQGLAQAQVKPIRRVLVLSDLGTISSPGFAEADQALFAGLQKSPYQIEFYNEALELTLFSDEGSQRRIHKDFIRKYSDRRLDLIIAAGSASLSFLESNKGFLRNTPIVFCAVLENISAQPNRNMHITGVLGRLHPMETLDAALHLAPFTKHVVVVGGMGTFDEPWEAIARQAFRKYEPQVQFTYVTDLTMPALLERLKHLPSNTIVYHTAITQDAAGNHFIDSTQSVPLVASAANAPVFVMDDVDLRDGTVGGDLVNWANDGRAAADMAVRILNGERPEDIPVVASKHAYMFDWRALQRWGLKESDLPPSSIVLNRPPSFWQLYKRYVLAGVLMLVAQALVIVALLWQWARRRNAENELAIMYDRHRLAMESGRAVGWEWDLKTGRNSWFGDLKTMFGIATETHVGPVEDFYGYVHPEDRKPVSDAVANARINHRPYAAEFRVVWPDGTVRWVTAKGKFCYSPSGEPERMLGMAQDITQRKLAEEALHESEERLRLAVQAGRMYAFEWDTASDVIVRSGQCRDILNWMDDPTLDTGRQFAARVHPGDREEYTATETGHTAENPVYQTTFRMLRPDDSVIWLEESGHAFFDDQGRLQRIIGMVADVTERKLAEEALSSVSRRLIEAQEQERARIARELHDDLSQRMALLSISLEQFEGGMPDLSSQARQHLHKIAEAATEVSSNIHDLSHQLHPYKLDTLGLVASLENFCREFCGQHNLQVQFVHHDSPGQIPKDVTICLFRIVQEALRNVVKHSGAAEAKVELSGHGDRVDLVISDSGAGFSPESAEGGTGLGLISMRERLRVVGGQLSIESEPSNGTRIRVRIPLPATNAQVTSEGKARQAGA